MTITKTKNKGNVLRMCIVTKKKYPKKELIRIIKNNEKYYISNTYHSQKGRSAYIQKNKSLWKHINKQKILHKTFRTNVPNYIYKEVESELNKYEEK